MQLRDLSFGPPPEEYPPEEQVLARHGLHSIDGFLSYCVLGVATAQSSMRSRRIVGSSFGPVSSRTQLIGLRVSSSDLATQRSHSYKASERHDVLDTVPGAYLKKKMTEHCRPVMERLSNETSISTE
jgi:hypothetical protein